MSATINVDLPISTQATENSLVVVGFDIDLDPSGTNGNITWPYTVLSDGDAVPGDMAITIYADTVTIYSDIINIGQNISIFAREIIVNPNVIINASAADTWVAVPGIPNYKIFDATPNPTPSAGSPGPNGANGGTGCNAGSITLVAQQFSALQSPPAYQSNLARLFNTGHLLESLFTRLWSDSKIIGNFENIPLQDFSYAFPPINFTFTLLFPFSKTIHINLALEIDFNGNQLIGAQNCSSITRSINQDGNTVKIDLDFGPIEISSQNVTVFANGIKKDNATINCSFVLGASLVFTLGADGITLTFNSFSDPAIQDVNLVLQDELFNGGRPFSLGSVCTGLIGSKLTQVIAPAFNEILPVLGNAFATAYNAVRITGGTLLTMANGGIGGRGEDGGTGGAGGTGGNGGSSGNGGNGGAITVYAGSVAPSFLLTIADPGFGELVALPGNGGESDTSANGIPGSAGAPGHNGNAGTITLNGSSYTYLEIPPPIDYTAFASQLSIGQLLLEQQGAKLAFISAEVPDDDAKTQDNYSAVIPLYQWLYAVTEPYVAGNPGNRPQAVVTTLQGINSAAGVALSRLVAGLSYYGTPITWTPATSASAWMNDISNFINYGNILSQAYSAASVEQADNQTQINEVKSTEGTINAQLDTLNSQITTLQGSVQSLSAAIGPMTMQIDNQVTKITNEITADAQSYLESIGTGCTLADIVKILQGIYAVGSGIVKAEEDIVGAATSIGKGLKDIYDANKDAIANLQTAEANVASLQAAWATLENDLGDNASAGVIAVDGDALETFVSQTFSGYSFTPQLLADMQALITLGQHRNTARSTLTIQVAQILKLQAEVTQLSNYAEYVQAMAAASTVPVQPQYVQFLANSYNYAANCIVDMMWEMNQALQYLTVTPSPLQLNGIDIATLTAKQAQLSQELTEAQEAAAQSFARFSEITYSIPCGPETPANSQLTASSKLVFSLPAGASNALFGSAGSVTLTGLTVTLDGLPAHNAQQSVNVSIGQLGPDSRYNVTTETWMEFTHAPITTEYQYIPSTGQVQIEASFASGADYNGVSPFSYWVLDFSSALNSWIDWSQVQTIVLGFSGTMEPKPVPLTVDGSQAADA